MEKYKFRFSLDTDNDEQVAALLSFYSSYSNADTFLQGGCPFLLTHEKSQDASYYKEIILSSDGLIPFDPNDLVKFIQTCCLLGGDHMSMLTFQLENEAGEHHSMTIDFDDMKASLQLSNDYFEVRKWHESGQGLGLFMEPLKV